MRMRKVLIAAALAVLPLTQHAAAVAPMGNGEPAMLVLTADAGEVATKGGKRILTLRGVQPLVAYTAALDKDRVFGSFHVKEFSRHWNSCNELKHRQNMWNKDGNNALIEYMSGVDNGKDGAYRKEAPLITNPKANVTDMVARAREGGMPLFIEHAAYNAGKATETFEIERGALRNGRYRKIVLLTECVLD
jgi:hypothetical protein